MRVEEIFKLREADEPRFWSEIANLFQKECSSPEFVAQVGPRLLDAGVKFTQMRQEFKQFPYHVGCALDVKEDSPFLFFVHFFANNKEEYERPVPLVLGVLPLPGDTYYVLHLHSDEDGTKNVVDVFAPHVFKRYATRAYRLASDDEALPDGWSVPQRFVWKKNPKAGGSSEAFFDEEAYKQLFVLTGKFFGRSKLSRLCENKDALSLEAQKTGSSDTLSCLWLDGMTYCVPMGQGLFHKTFIPYWPDASASDDASISNEQLEAIKPELEALLRDAAKYSPSQCQCEDFKPANYVSLHQTIGSALKDDTIRVQRVQDEGFRLLKLFEQKGWVELKSDVPPKFKAKEVSGACKTLKSFCKGEGELNQQMAFSLLVLCSRLWWHLRGFEDWYDASGRRAVLQDSSAVRYILLTRGVQLLGKINAEVELLKKANARISSLLSNN